MYHNFRVMSTNWQAAKDVPAISSNVRGRNGISVFHRTWTPKLELGKYLQGRSYQLFKRGIKAKKTLEYYNRGLYYFCDYLHLTTEQIVEKYGPFVKKNGRSRPNVEGLIEFQRHFENYVLVLQERVDSGEIKPSTCGTLVSPAKLFADMNDIPLNWKKLSRLLPRSDLVASDEAYSREQIKKMLEFCDLRARIIVLFFASSGMRLGGLAGLKDGDITPIPSRDDPGNVVAAHVVVYAGTEDEYDTFVSGEAWTAYVEYRGVREKYGETITKTSPVLIGRFNAKTMKDGRAKALDYGTIRNIVSAVCHKAGVMEQSPHYKDRFVIKRVHGFRKFFNTTLRSIKTKDGKTAVDFINKERLLGHALINQHALEENYDRSDMVKELLAEYVKAVAELTVSDQARLRLKVGDLQNEVKRYKTVEVEISARDKQIHELTKQLGELQGTVRALKAGLDELTPLAGKNVGKAVGAEELEEIG